MPKQLFQPQFYIFNLAFRAFILTVLTLTANNIIYAQVFNPQSKLDTTFQNPAVMSEESEISKVWALSDGKFLVAGKFDIVNNKFRQNLAKFNQDGTVDTSFNPIGEPFSGSDNREVSTLAVQTDGKILVAWNSIFSNPNVYRLYRMNTDGSIDTSYTDTGFSAKVRSITIQPDGKCWIAVGANVTRFSANGAFDFNILTNGNVESLASQPDGKVLVGGTFSTIAGTARNNIARLNANGSIDTTFNQISGANNTVKVVKVLPDEKILIGGLFSSYDGVSRSAIARLNANGTLDTSFVPLAGTTNVNDFVLKDDKIWVAGWENPTANFPNRRVAILNSDGTLSGNTQTFNRGISSIAIFPDRSILVGGAFTRTNVRGSSGVVSPHLVRYLPNGSTDLGFTTLIANLPLVHDILIQGEGRSIVTGSFTLVDGRSCYNIVRLNENGSVNSCLLEGPNDAVFSVASQTDGKIILGGNFTELQNQPTQGIARLTASPSALGEKDTTFNLSPNFTAQIVRKVIVQPDGKILVAGKLSVNNELKGVVRLNSDGSLDSSFTPYPIANNTLFNLRMELLPNGQIIFGGFDSAYLFRLNSNGTFDLSFASLVSPWSLAVQPDGKVLAGGITNIFTVFRFNADGSRDLSFSSTGNATGNPPTFNSTQYAFNLLPDGKIMVGGLFSETNKNYLDVLDARTGAKFPTFTSLIDRLGAGEVRVIKNQPDGKILVGGRFASYNGSSQFGVLRLRSDLLQTRRTRFDFDGDGKADIGVFRPSNGTWYAIKSQTSSALITQWGISGDKIVPADYDNDGKTDTAVYRNGIWYLLQSNGNTFRAFQWGLTGDIPNPGNFVAGNGLPNSNSDYLSVFRNGTWWNLGVTGSISGAFQFGQADDKPLVGDFDGDGISDYAVYRNGAWFINGSYAGVSFIEFGLANDKPVPADYDSDGKDDIAVYRDGVWYLLRSNEGLQILQFGLGTDIPVPADYDGDGRADIAVFRPSNGTWYILQSRDGLKIIQYGTNGDQPIPAAYIR